LTIGRVYVDGALHTEYDIEPGYYVDVTLRGSTKRLRGGGAIHFGDPDSNAYTDIQGPIQVAGDIVSDARKAIRSVLPW
jgi:hypothetical protein